MDAPADPLATAVAPETGGAVLFSEGLSTLPSLLSDHGLSREGMTEAEAWHDSWTMEEAEGAELRDQLHSLAARRLLPHMGPAGVRDLLDKNGRSISGVGAVRDILVSEAVSSALEQASGLQSEARVALLLGEVDEALTLGLKTVDVLWTVSPQHVAEDLLEKARSVFGRNQDSGAYSMEELIRIRRLMFGASEALEEGDYTRAIRRAYYACQLLGADTP